MARLARFVSIILFLLLLLCLPAQCFATGKTVVMVMNRTSLRQTVNNIEIGSFMKCGAAALLNVSTAGRITDENVFVTLGAGSRAIGTGSTRLAFNASEEYSGIEAYELFLLHQGRAAQGQVFHLASAEMQRANTALQHPVIPGLLGETLQNGKKVTAVLGNSDAHGLNRVAAAMLSDISGEINLGDVSHDLLKSDSSFPFGLRMDRELVWQKFREVKEKADVVLVDWGDTVRLDEYRGLLSDEVYQNLMSEIFLDAAWFVRQVSAEMAKNDLLVMLSPSPPKGETGGGQLTYITVYGEGFLPGSLITSAGTRQPGIVMATDVAPLILTQAGLDVPAMMLGSTISASEIAPVASLIQRQDNIDRIHRLRPPLLKTYVFFQIVIVLFALTNFFIPVIRIPFLEAPLLALLLFPVIVLYLPLQHVDQVLAFILTGFSVSVFVALLYYFWRNPLGRFAVVGLITSFSLIVDMLRNAALMKVSVLGYDVVSGARFYGLGNEYMGVLIGSTLLGTSALLAIYPRWRKVMLPILSILYLLLVLLIVSPAGGANFGGTVSALSAFLVMLLICFRVKWRWQSGLIILAVMSVVVFLSFYINWSIPHSAQSHLGRTLSLFNNTGWEAMTDLINRKAAMNIRLFRYSQWSRAFLAFLIALAVLFYRPRGVLKNIRRQYPDLSGGFFGIIAGSSTAFIMNDSGVVAAATALLYAGVPIILLSGRILIEQNNLKS